jgi:hypothetical protein
LSKAAVARLVGSDDALSTERAYVATVLPAAVLRELRARRPRAAAAIVVALGATTAGYLRGRLPGATSEVRLPATDGRGPLPPPSPDAPTEMLAAVSPQTGGG